MAPSTDMHPQESRRITALRDSLHTALKSAFRSEQLEVALDIQEFRTRFPTLADEYLDAIYDVYGQVLHLVRANSEAEFEEICEDADLWNKLSTLEQLCEEQCLAEGGQAGVSGAQPDVQPLAVARRCRVQAKQREAAQIKELLAKYEEQHIALEAQLASKREALQRSADLYQPVLERLSKVHLASQAWAKRPVGATA